MNVVRAKHASSLLRVRGLASDMNGKRELLRFQFVSDLHLECWAHPTSDHPRLRIEPRAPVLVIAGDLGRAHHPAYGAFLAAQCGAFEHVVLTAGNHEYHQPAKPLQTVAQTDAALKSLELAWSNLHVLQKATVDIGGVRFLGATLWSEVPPSAADRVGDVMSDYSISYTDLLPSTSEATTHRRKDGWVRLTVDDTNAMHREHRDWLDAAIAASDRPTVVVTHHAPTKKHIAPKFLQKYGDLNLAYHSNLDALLRRPVCAWISGHSHSALSFYAGPETNVLCGVNCGGYPSEYIDGYDVGRVVTVWSDGSATESRDPDERNVTPS